jgi:polysaccharide pyruvyl transferase
VTRVLITEIGNTSSGDEAMLIGTARRLRALGAGITFLERVSLADGMARAGLTVEHQTFPLDGDFEATRSLDELVRLFADAQPGRFRELCDILRWQDLVALAPGDRITGGYKIARGLITGTIALSLGLPIVLLHQSLGPVATPNHRTLLAEFLRRAELVLARDARSAAFIHEFGVCEAKVVVCGDIVLGEDWGGADAPDHDLGLNPRFGFNGHARADAMQEFIEQYRAARPRARILIYSTTFDLPREVLVLASAQGCTVEPRVLRYPNVLRTIARSRVNVSDSFHGALFSMLADRAVICLRPDFQTWKLEGIHAPGDVPLGVLPGFVNHAEARRVVERVRAVEENPTPTLDHQRRIVAYGRAGCERGWAALAATLERKVQLSLDSE